MPSSSEMALPARITLLYDSAAYTPGDCVPLIIEIRDDAAANRAWWRSRGFRAARAECERRAVAHAGTRKRHAGAVQTLYALQLADTG